jgi:hypothetical protein
MKSKLFVAGCSVSDYTLVDEVYGEMLSKKLNYDYVHEAAGCGSNWRIWRKITNFIINGELNKNDLLIIQYTSNERREFWTMDETDQISGNINIRERYENGGSIIRFKANSHIWQNTKDEKTLFKLYEKNFLNSDFENDVFRTQNFMFQHLLKTYNIPTIFFNFCVLNPYIEELDTKIFKITEILDDPNFFLENDMFHLNHFGHEYVSNKLYEYIFENKIK